jgi:eukaryotic-like serine/threonine-protein kinase
MSGSEVGGDETTKCGRCAAAVPAASRYCMSCGSLVTLPPEAAAPEDDGEANLQRVRAALAPDFEVLSELGRGGMAIVYKAVETELQRLVAIKVLPPDMVSPRAAERFRREARLAAGLDHRTSCPSTGWGTRATCTSSR